MRPLDNYIKEQLNNYTYKIGNILEADIIAIMSPIFHGLDLRVRAAVEKFTNPKKKIAIIIDTGGGVVEVVERMVYTIRHYYSEVIFIIPNIALSAGTVFVMSGDRILMDFFSCLGPIDPQVEKDGKFVPALSYLNQYERLNKKAIDGTLTSAEYALLGKLDLGELEQFKQAKDLSIELLIKWLSLYKFKHYKLEQSKKEASARRIANDLINNEKWHSHGRGINMEILKNEIKLEIEDFSKIKDLQPLIRGYFELSIDYMNRENIISFVHSKEFF